MTRFSISSLALLFVLSAGLSGCGKKKAAEEEVDDDSLTCETNDDCEAGWVCLAGECANSASGAIYTDPSHAVTPDKVKNQVDQINEASQKRADEILDGL